MSVEGKIKDTYIMGLDLEVMSIICDLHPIRKDGETHLLPACYMLNYKEKKKFCEFLCTMKLPNGYSFNISRGANVNDFKIVGLKGHDYYIILQRLLSIGLRGLLRKDVCKAIIDLCMFFKELTSRILKVDMLDKLNKNIV